MRRLPALRVLALASLSALAAVVAHGGPQLLTDPRWALPAGLAAVAACWAGATAVALAGRGLAPRPGSVWATAGLLACGQTAAHAALLAVGVMPASGQAGAVALHLLLALAGALVVAAGERLLAARAADVLARLLELLAAADPRRPWPAAQPRPAVVRSAHRGRAPPRA
jgi:hypothetical protein